MTRQPFSRASATSLMREIGPYLADQPETGGLQGVAVAALVAKNDALGQTFIFSTQAGICARFHTAIQKKR